MKIRRADSGAEVVNTLLLLVVASLTLVASGNATEAAPTPWRLAVFDAVFVGVVECERAGLIFADYRVIDSWKGAAVGSPLRIAHEPDDQTYKSPVSVVGEQSLVLAMRLNGPLPRSCFSSMPGCGEPVWWRDIPCSLWTKSSGGLLPVDLGHDEIMGVPALPGLGRFSVFKSLVRRFLDLSDDDQEATILKDPYGEGRIVHLPGPSGNTSAFGNVTFVDEVAGPPPIQSVLDSLLNTPRPGRGKRDTAAWRVGQCGGDRMLGVLRSEHGLRRFGSGTTDWWHPIRRILRRRGIESRELPHLFGVERVVAESTALHTLELQGLEGLVGEKLTPGDRHRYWRAFTYLTVVDPNPVAGELMRIKPREGEDDREREEIYAMASYFGWRCGRDRERHLHNLLRAPHPIVRVAAAVYLSFSDSATGTQSLRGLANLPGFAGAWAAVVLSSRGDKSWVPRALEILRLPANQSGSTHSINDLQSRLVVLLSNSAVVSKVQRPPSWETHRWEIDDKTTNEERWRRMTTWWNHVLGQIAMSDPWSPSFQEQRVD